MKKIMVWLAAISIITFVIDWIIVGLCLLEGNYEITAGAYIGLICLVVFFVCMLYLRFTNRCKHCQKLIQSYGKYCPYCGKEIK